MASEDNYCVIYVWVPRDEDGNHVGSTLSTFSSGDDGTVGHVSIETKDFYRSFWPNNRVAAEGKTALFAGGTEVVMGGYFAKSYEEDTRLNHDKDKNPRNADFKIILYSLDVEHMKKAFDKFETREGFYTWSLAGRGLMSRVLFRRNDGDSCASFVYDLLHHGGLFKKLSCNIDLARDIFVANPNNMLKMVVNAKYDELNRHPQTRIYKKPFDTIASVPSRADIAPSITGANKCNPM